MKTQEINYQQQAKDFLNKWGIGFHVKRATNKCPPFCDGKHIHGDHYQVFLCRPMTGKRLFFPFWNSLNDSQNGKAPTPYDVLACIGGDLTCPDDYAEFCGEYGYDTDSRTAHATWLRCSRFSKKLNDFFDTEEMQADLQTIN